MARKRRRIRVAHQGPQPVGDQGHQCPISGRDDEYGRSEPTQLRDAEVLLAGGPGFAR